MTTYTVEYRRPSDIEWHLWSRYSHCTIGLPVAVAKRIDRDGNYSRIIVEYEA